MQVTAFSQQLTQAIASISKPLLYKLLEISKVANTFDVTKIDKVTGAVDGHFASLNGAGAVLDSGKAVVTGDVVGTTDAQVLSNKELTAPVINDFTNAVHTHMTESQGGRLPVSWIICNNDQVVCNNNEVITI